MWASLVFDSPSGHIHHSAMAGTKATMRTIPQESYWEALHIYYAININTLGYSIKHFWFCHRLVPDGVSNTQSEFDNFAACWLGMRWGRLSLFRVATFAISSAFCCCLGKYSQLWRQKHVLPSNRPGASAATWRGSFWEALLKLCNSYKGNNNVEILWLRKSYI